MKRSERMIHLIRESPSIYRSMNMQNYIEREIEKPGKKWIQDILHLKRETEFTKVNNDQFILLPDLNSNRQREYSPNMCHEKWEEFSDWTRDKLQRSSQESVSRTRALPDWAYPKQNIAFDSFPKSENIGFPPPNSTVQVKKLNWIAIMHDSNLRSIRDLRAEHVDLLEDMYNACMSKILEEYQLKESDIMVFANYPPSVYRLHFHFCAPFVSSASYDAFRIHPLQNILNNLRMCPDYYRLSTLEIPVLLYSDLNKALENKRKPENQCDDTSEGTRDNSI